MVDGMVGRQGASCRADPGREAGNSRTDDGLCEAVDDGAASRWSGRGPFCCEGSSHLQGQRVSSLRCYYWA